MLTDAQRYELDVRGVLVLPRVLGTDEVRRLNAAIDDLRLPAPDDDLWSQRIQDLLLLGQPFVDLLDHGAALSVLEEVHGPHTRVDHCYAIRMAPGTGGLGLHGGPVPFDPAQYFVHDGDGLRLGLVALQWALVDHPPGLGGFGCIPGSHRAGRSLPDGAHHLVREISMQAGDLVVFTEALVHGTIPWQGAGERRTLLYKYSPASSSWGDPDEVRRALALPMTERQRLLLQAPSVGHHIPVW